MLGRLPAILTFLAVFALIPFSPSASQGEPRETIDSFHVVLIDVMKNAKELGYQGRFDKLAPAIDRTVNIPVMARWAVGRHWEDMSEDQRARLVKAFRDFTVANYASRFDGYKGERFETVGEKTTKRNDVLVRTQLVKRSGKKIKIFYLMRKSGERWYVIDVFTKGVSQVATRRSEYTSVLRRASADKLIDAIQSKTRLLAEP